MQSQMYVAGRWRTAIGGGSLDVVDPATERRIGSIAYGGAEDATGALEAASAALPGWRNTPGHARGEALRKVAAWIRSESTRLAEITTSESGKPLRESRGEWSVAADLFDYYAALGSGDEGRLAASRLRGREIRVIHEPIGVVGVITAWNFPAYNPTRAIAAALAAGCTIVCRPAELTPYSGIALAEAADAAGLPAGALNLINGEPGAIAGVMLSDPRCRKLSFTGSTRVGKSLISGSAETVTSLSLELGGNAPVIVTEDAVRHAGVEEFAKAAVASRFRNCGQVCIAPQRFYVERGVYAELVAALAARVDAVRVGAGSDPLTEVGPMISSKQRDRIEALLAGRHGGRVLAGGGRPAGREAGCFFEPTLVADIDRASALWREETFGPVLVVSPFEEINEALSDANSLEAGLAAYAFVRDEKLARKLADELEFGMVAINGWLPHATEAPFPGWKQSGLGAESGPEGLDEYRRAKVVSRFAL